MLKTILRFEAKLLRADGTALLTAGVFLALIGYAGYVGIQYADEQQAVMQTHAAQYAERIADIRQQVVEIEAEMVQNGEPLDTKVELGRRHPYMIGSAQGRVITLMPGPLSAFAVGQSDLQPNALRVTMGGSQAIGGAASLENPFKLLVGHFDLAFVFVFLFPLLILALTFGLTTAERETGLLRMVLAQPVRLTTLAAGKVMVRAVLLFVCAVLGTGAVLLMTSASDGGGRWLLWLLVVFAYGGFWMALAAFVDSRVRRPVTGGLVLAVCWLAFVVVIPALINVVASTLYPVPSRMEYVTAMRTETSVAQQQGAASLAQFFDDHPELASVEADEADYAMLRVARDERIAEALAPVEARFAEQKARQQQFIRSLGYLSPAVLAQQAFLDLADTGHARYAAFTEAVEALHTDWKAYFVPKYFAGLAFRPNDYDTVPAFTFSDFSTVDVLKRMVGSLTALVLASVLLGMVAYRRYARTSLVA